MARLLTSHLFWLLTFVVGWLVAITLLIANGHGAAPGS